MTWCPGKSPIRRLLTFLGMVALFTSGQAYASPTPAARARFDITVAEARATMLTDPRETIARSAAVATAALSLNGHERTIGEATANWLAGEAYLRINDTAHAGPLIDRAWRAIAADPPTKLSGDILLSMGGYHTATANVAAALSDYQRAHDIYRDLGDVRSRTIALLSIALLYQEAADDQNALRYYDQARQIYSGDPSLMLSIYNNRANALEELGRHREGEAQFQQALTLARSMRSPALEEQILRNIIRSQLLGGNIAAADRTIAQRAATIRTAHLNLSNEQMWSVLAQSELQHGRLADAQRVIELVFAGVDTTQTTLAFHQAHETAYALYTRLGDHERTLVHLQALKRLDDQTSRLAASANTALAAARFDFANQELRIARLRQDELARNVAFERQRAATQQMIFIGAAVATLVIVGMLGFGVVTLRRSRNRVRAANIDLGRTNIALEKALAAKTEFLATTSHEIRTPLNGILGMTQVMLADGKLDAQLRDRIGIVHGAGVSMRALVDDILDVAKMETGNLTIEEAPFDLAAMLADVSRMWQEQAVAKKLAFTLDVSDAPPCIVGDTARLRQIVFNLLSNALKFTDTGDVSIVARAEDDRLRIVVRDTGIGIPADKHDIIFESFRQGDAGTARRFGGTGLGLSICRNLARAMGGNVTVESDEGQGATFTLDLPLLLGDLAGGGCSPEAAGVLILDKNPISRSVLKAVLEPRLGAVTLVGTVTDAIVAISGASFRVVVVDQASLDADNPEGSAADLIDAAPRNTQIALLRPAGAKPANWTDRFDLVLSKPLAGAALAGRLATLVDDRAEAMVPLATAAG